MTPKKLHKIFHEAMQECPQFDYIDNDQYISGWGEFGKIPNKGYAHVINFWKEETSLFDMSYDTNLPQEVHNLLKMIDELFEKSVNKVMKGQP